MTPSCHSLAELPQRPRSLQNPITAGRASYYMTLIGPAKHSASESLITSAVLSIISAESGCQAATALLLTHKLTAYL
jgi:hypothetical protein